MTTNLILCILLLAASQCKTDPVPENSSSVAPDFWDKKHQLVDGYVSEINSANKSNPLSLLEIYSNYRNTLSNSDNRTPGDYVPEPNPSLAQRAQDYLEKLQRLSFFLKRRLALWANETNNKLREDEERSDSTRSNDTPSDRIQ